ncbi:MAG: hypothetical protein IIA60_14880 [Candidatus Marinimicrobia bacterium]|nr:hypothetical protein [Candidatus Neomarinimicrobiota bacterium]
MATRKNSAGGGALKPLPMYMGAAALIVLGMLLSTVLIDQSAPSRAPGAATATQVYSSAVLDIARDFYCACGNCGDKELVVCGCDTAIQEKNYIHDLLEKGYEKESINATVQAMFGGGKT